MIRCTFLIKIVQVATLSLVLLIAPGCCWGGCFDKCQPCQPCSPCKPCDDSCVVKEPAKTNRAYIKNQQDFDDEMEYEIVD